MKTAIIGLLGVLLGALITSSVIFISAQQDRKQQLAMAALPERLAAHQEAYAIWWDIYDIIRDGDSAELVKSVVAAREWWSNHNLYLTPEASKDFMNFTRATVNQMYDWKIGKIPDVDSTLVSSGRKVDEKYSVDIMLPALSIPAGVGLPDFGEKPEIIPFGP